MERAIEADVERQRHAARRGFAQLLRRMPLARAHVVGDRRLELDLDALRRPGVHAERMRKRRVGQLLDRREPLLEQRHFLDAFDRERPHFAVLGHVGEEIQRLPARRRAGTG